MMKKIILFLIITISPLFSQEYMINVKAGWQLIGLPTDVDNMRIFNNNNVRLVWHYNGKYREWVGYSPLKDITKKIEERKINLLNSVKKWQGVWVYSFNDWDLIVDDEAKLEFNSPDINSVELFEGWNLISLPFDTIISSKIFDGYKLWRYGKFNNEFDSNWQTNQQFSHIGFPEVDEINSKSGFWVHSPEYREIDFSNKSAEFYTEEDITKTLISKFETSDEVENYIKNSLLVSNRENKYWNWTISRGIYETETPTEKLTILDNAITNDNDVNQKYFGVKNPDILQKSDDYLFYRSSDSKSVIVVRFDDILFDKRAETTQFTPNFTYGTSTINSFFIDGNRLIVISNLIDEKQNSTFVEDCRKNKAVVSIYEMGFNPVSKISERHIFIDGDYNNSRMIDSNLYILTNFKPCIKLDYPKIFLNPEEYCNLAVKNTIEYKDTCYDVLEDKISGNLFRFNYENPITEEVYALPKYLIAGESSRQDLISPESFFTSTKIKKESSLFSLSYIDTVSGKIEKSATIFEDIKNIYLSGNSLYFSSNSSPDYLSFREFRDMSNIYKFDYYPTIEYKASGSIKGNLLNRFSFNEQDKNLMVVTKDKFSWTNQENENRLEIFQERDKKFEKIGAISNIVNNAFSLESLKFYGSKAIASTNSISSPFQLIDLDNPSLPKKGNSLEISGDSEYIYYSEDSKRLFSFGREVKETGSKGGVQINLFDLGDIDNPKLEASRVLGDYFNYSPLFFNPKSLGFRDSDNSLAVPIYSDGAGSQATVGTGIHIFDIKELETKTVISNNLLQPLLKVSTINKYENDGRTIFVDKLNLSYVVFVTKGKLNIERFK